VFVVTVWCVFSYAAHADIEKGLYLYLPLNEGSGDTLHDLSPNKFKAEMSDSKPKWTPAKGAVVQTALEFNGKDNFVKIDMTAQGKDFDAHADKNKGMTICAWVKVIKTAVDAHGQNRQPIVMKGNSGKWEFALYVYDNLAPGMSVWDCGGSGVSEPSGGNLGADWRYQCGTFTTKDGVKVYLDADKAPVAQAGVGGNAPCDGDRPVFLAHREDGQWLNASIAEVRMWERVISVDEMAEAMKTIGGLAVSPKGKLTTTWNVLKRQE
jgi:hypothetical protein